MKQSNEAPEYDGPSKTRRKKDSHALQDLGERLVALPAHRLYTMPLEPSLLEAIVAAQSITSHEGRRRQLQYVGKLMRRVDAEPIRVALDLQSQSSRAATALLHEAEHWRTRLLGSANEPRGNRRPAGPRRGEREGSPARDDWFARFPDTDADQLDRLLDGAGRELAAGAGGRSYRELYRLLRDTLQAAVVDAAGRPATDRQTAGPFAAEADGEDEDEDDKGDDMGDDEVDALAPPNLESRADERSHLRVEHPAGRTAVDQ